MRRLLGRVRGPRRPPAPAPPSAAAGDVALLDRPPEDEAFITGNGIAARCGWARNHGAPYANEGGRSEWFFCKTDFVEWFLEHEAPKGDFVLFTHNSDLPVDSRFARHLRRRRLRAWFAANVAFDHPKLHPLPLGLANPHWPHGDVGAVHRVQAAPPRRERLLDVSFSLGTNPTERRYCLAQAGLELMPPLPFPRYLERLASAFFSLCPSGNGIDTHRTWEALYVGTVPIVTRSALTDAHGDLPLVVLDDWAQLRSLELSPESYERVRGRWDPSSLRLDRYLDGLEASVS